MQIYKLRPDFEIQSLWPPTNADHEVLMNFDGRPWASVWRPMAVTLYKGKEAKRNRKLGDFPSFRSNAPVFSRRAVEGLRDLLEPNGEILPLVFSGADYFVFNVTTLSDALDEERSEIKRFPSGVGDEVDRFEFHSDQLGSAAVFKLVQTPTQNPFVTDVFVQRVLDLGLTGLEFKCVWEA